MARLTEEEKLLRTITESTFQKWVQQVMAENGWRYYHSPANVPRNGFIQNIKAGFPDLVAVRGTRLIFAELKREIGKTTDAQDDWLGDLKQTLAEVYIWKPRDKALIREILS